MLRYILYPLGIVGIVIVVIGGAVISFGWFLVNLGTTMEADQ